MQTVPAFAAVRPLNAADLADFFDHAPLGSEFEPGLVDVHFGELLVEHGFLDRGELLRALQLQDERPYLRIGQCALALGFITRKSLTHAIALWNGLESVAV